MPDQILKDLDPRLQKQVQSAEQSIQRGNANYAIDICSGILQKHPGCVDVRKILRKAQKKAAAAKGKGSKMFSGVTNAPFMMKANSQVKKDPLQAMETAEKMLNVNPANVPALKLLSQAAQEADFPETAIAAMKDIKEVEPKNIENLLALGEVYISLGRPQEAGEAAEAALKVNPAHGGAQDLVRRASVSHSIEKGKWDDEGSDFREKLRDEEQATKLEQKSRNINDAETLNKLISEVYEEIQQNPENINHYKTIADYYRKLGDLENAGAWIAHARTMPTGAADTTLEELQTELYVEQLENGIAERETALEADPENTEIAADLEGWKQTLSEYKLQTARDRVERYPNNYEYRYNLGCLLSDHGDIDGAIQQFQLSQRNPKVRQKSLLRLGKAFKQAEKWPLAVDQLTTAHKEMLIMDAAKKEVIYELADAYEKMGQTEEAYENFKELYQSDISFRDVSDRFNAIYNQKMGA